MKMSSFIHEMQTTSAVFGRETGAYVTFEGDSAFTDGKRINLPSIPLDTELTPDLVRLMRGYVDHEASHLRNSDMPVLMDKYKRWINNEMQDLKNLHNCIEDRWIERKTRQDYPGSTKNLYTTGESVKEKEYQAIQRVTESGGEVPFNAETIGMYLRAADPAYRRPDNHFDKIYNTLDDDQRKWIDKWGELIDETDNTQDAIDLAKSIYKKVEEWEQPESEGPSGEDPSDFDAAGGADMEDGELPKDMSDSEAMEGTGGMEGAFGDPSGAAEGKDGEEPGGEGLIDNLKTLSDRSGYKVYTTKHDKVITGDGSTRHYLDYLLRKGDIEQYEYVKSSLSDTIRVLKAKLRRLLLARVQRDWDRGRIEGALDSKRLVSAVLGSENVYKKRSDLEDEDTAIYVLIDLSGSMGARNKAEVAHQACVALAECFEGTSFKVKFVGFSNDFTQPDDVYYRGDHEGGPNHRYLPTNTVVFKNWDTPLRKARKTMGCIEYAVGGHNSDYDFIEAGLSELKKRKEKRKVLFVLSDGRPEHDSDYSTNDDIDYAKKAIKKASQEGIDTIGIGIMDDTVKRIYPDVVVIKSVQDLPKVVLKKMAKFI